MYLRLICDGDSWFGSSTYWVPPDLEPGNILVTIPGDDAPPPARDEVREAFQATITELVMLQPYLTEPHKTNIGNAITAARAALATKGPAK